MNVSSMQGVRKIGKPYRNLKEQWGPEDMNPAAPFLQGAKEDRSALSVAFSTWCEGSCHGCDLFFWGWGIVHFCISFSFSAVAFWGWRQKHWFC